MARIWCDVHLRDREGCVVSRHRLDGVGRPDLGAVDWLARIRLEALRRDQTIEVVTICPDLAALLDYAGL